MDRHRKNAEDKIQGQYLTIDVFFNIMAKLRGVAKFGIALGSGPRGLGFESRHSDHKSQHSLIQRKVLVNGDFSLFICQNVYFYNMNSTKTGDKKMNPLYEGFIFRQ